MHKVKTFLSEKLTAEIEAVNAIYTDDPLRTDITFYTGYYDPTNLTDYPAVIIAVDKVEPDVNFPVHTLDILLITKSDDQNVLNAQGIRYGDALSNAFLDNHRIDDEIHISEIASVDHMAGTGLYLIDLLLTVESTR